MARVGMARWQRWSGAWIAVVGLFGRSLPLLLLLPCLALTPDARADDSLKARSVWARASLTGASNGIAYATLVNEGGAPARIVGGSTPVAAHVEFHLHAMSGGMMTMKQLEAIEVKPGETVVLKPGGLHVMLVGLKQRLKQGESFPLTLKLAGGPSIAVEVKVLGPGAMGPPP
jgi:periplasmic copper chaperone A